ncbi:MAG TPA: exopolyphosphatase [Planctomycetota bacterium]|nr:exopolyphosphatase [Planctomycetota bacterium]
MRIITRGDFDGLSSTVLLTEVEKIGEIKMVHPKDAQDGKVKADAEDIVVNLPYIPGCGLWFDHHVSEEVKLDKQGAFKGRFEVAPSCARVIANHYQSPKFDRFTELLEATDKLDSAQLSTTDVTTPEGWILLGLTLDPRTGLGPEFQKYFRWLAEYIKEVPLEKVLKHPEVMKRTERVREEQEDHEILLAKHARKEGNVILTDFRGVKDKPVGNRFLVFSMFRDANVEVRLFNGHEGAVVAAVGASIFNRSCKVNIGQMLAEYGGGGHKGAGTAQLKPANAEKQIAEIIARLNA